MPIPELEDDYLPSGIYDCSFREMCETFGYNETRRNLLDKLTKYLDLVYEEGIRDEIIVNGSFVTSKEEPSDIDIIVIIGDNSDYELLAPITRIDDTLLRRSWVKNKFNIHIAVGLTEENSPTGYDEHGSRWIDIYSNVLDNPEIEKGMLRIVYDKE